MRVTIRTKQLLSGEQSIYLDIYHAGKRRYEFLSYRYSKDKEHNKEIKKIVEGIRNKRELELMNNEHGFTTGFKRKANFIDYFQKWIDSKKGEQSVNSISLYENALKKLKKFSGNKIRFQEVDEKWIEQYKTFLIKKEKISQNTAKDYLAIMKRVLKQAVKDKIIQTNPADFTTNLKSKDIKRDFLTIEEIKKLSETEFTFKYPDIKKAFLFSCFTGLRYSDVKRLTWKDIKQDHLSIKQQKTQEYVYIPLSKTAKSILFNSNVIHLTDKPVFNIPDRFSISGYLKKWFKIAGIEKNGHYHLSRHTFAVMNITQGVEIYTLSKLLGHKNMRTTEIYSNIIDEKKKQAMDNLPVFEVSL